MKELVEEMPDEGYGCAVANRFGRLLDDESDPFDILYAAGIEKKQKKKKEEPKKTPTTTKSGKKETQRDRKIAVPAGGGGQGQVRLARGEVEERIERRVTFERKFSDADTPLSFSVERPVDVLDRPVRGRGTGRGRGARGPGYPRSSDGFDQRGKREFERHSGSDRASVRSEEKRSGSGSRNWGSVRDHMSEIEEGSPSEVVETEETQEAVETDGENRPSETEEVIEVALEMTLDEWKALQEQSRPKVELNIRKADTSVPSKAVVIHKSKFIQKRRNGLDEEDVVFRRPANDITCQLEINFGSLARPSRGGRGGRGGRGRGAPSMPSQRSPQKLESAPNPDDPEDFPALA
ncbi:Intracellular hyaluronan-binding protein 4 [Labeo rohita]|uniref:Intracellular hyaluronan-binding protein 4 n=1 Tax=Labeo rohita TaxID=84645 RepID=A0ABQ8LL75_LABRO|nr:plasminogen activator inhibitor 1 RNA-binding protein [Labeo rohita]KAI2651410.1 Intracellular hyaluronan-binding protein 4 [Labeo rohita]